MRQIPYHCRSEKADRVRGDLVPFYKRTYPGFKKVIAVRSGFEWAHLKRSLFYEEETDG